MTIPESQNIDGQTIKSESFSKKSLKNNLLLVVLLLLLVVLLIAVTSLRLSFGMQSFAHAPSRIAISAL